MKQERGICMNARRELMSTALERIQRRWMRLARNNTRLPQQNEAARFDVEEIFNNPYINRQEIPLAMDIFRPVVPKGQELPVIVAIHGGGLVVGDRKMYRNFARVMAARGYLVFTLEYRLVPRANVAEQLDDICAGMDLVGQRLVDFDVDFSRMYLTAESAGAFLAVYVAAMKHSRALQKAIGYEPTRMVFKGLGLFSGMFYTNRNDPIGWFLSRQFYGEKQMEKAFLKYMNPEHPEILKNLPPTFLVTSRGDFLNNYSILYHNALKRAGRPTRLVYYGDKELGHAFVTLEPCRAQSSDALSRMTAWFEEQSANKYSQAESAYMHLSKGGSL